MRAYSIGVFFDVWNIDHKKWHEQADFIRSLGGVDHVELMLEIVDLKPRDIALLKKLLGPYKVVLHAPFMNLDLHSPHPEIVEASLKVIGKSIKIGKQLGASTMTLHIDSHPNYYTKQQVTTKTRDVVNKLASEVKMRIGVENMSKGGNMKLFYPSQPEHFYLLSKVFNKDVGFTLDTGHFLFDEYDPVKIIDKLGDKIFDIHLHDGKKKKAHLELGKGKLDLEGLIEILDRVKYSGYLTLEVMGRKEIAASWNTLNKALNA